MREEGFGTTSYILFAAVALMVFIICVTIGSVTVPLLKTVQIILDAVCGKTAHDSNTSSIILSVRIPRVMCVALVGASLSLCGAAMQGLLRNPLADGSTLGVSSGASLGAVIAIALGISIPALPFAGTTVLAIVFAFASLILILGLSYKLDFSLSTNTIILIGIVFSMFASSLISLVITFVGEKAGTIVFWTMGSLSGSTYLNAVTLLITLTVCGFFLIRRSSELNAFSVGENFARGIGVDVRRVKVETLVAVSVLIGVCVSIGGTIGFVGLVTPHMVRMITGPNHKKLLPASIFGGAVLLMLCDLLSRTVLRPRELPVGVITSLIGAVLFVIIYNRSRRAHR